MTDSLAERAILEVVRRCGLILTASGYNTNIGTNVLRAQRNVDLKASTPAAVVVWDAGDTPAARADGTVHAFTVDQLINVEVHTIASQAQTGVLIGGMKADVKRAVMSGSSGKLSDGTGEIGSIGYTGSTPAPREAGASTEYMTIGFSVKFKEAYGNPNSSQRLM